MCFYLRKCLRNHSSSFVLTLTQYSVVHLWFCYIIYTWLVCSATFSSLFLNASLNTKWCILCLWFLLHFIYLCRSKIPFGPLFPLSTDSLPRPLSVFLSCTVGIQLCLSMEPYLLIYFLVCLTFPHSKYLTFLISKHHCSTQHDSWALFFSFIALICKLSLVGIWYKLSWIFYFLVMPMSPKGECSMCFVTSGT